MIEIFGNLWDQKADIFCITTNGTVTLRGKAVMGRGCALEARSRYKDIDAALGIKIRKAGSVVQEILPGLYSFPVKHNYWERADIKLIRKSCIELVNIVNNERYKKIVIPRPGCGYGGLSWQDVRPVLNDYFDDRFYIITNK